MLHTLKRFLVFVVALVIVGCGGGENDEIITSTPNSETSETSNVSINQETNSTTNNGDMVGVVIVTRDEIDPIIISESIQDFSSPSGKSYETPPIFPSFE